MSTQTLPWPELTFDREGSKRMKFNRYFYKLESESSSINTDDTESIHSVQGKETDIVRDTSDTGSLTSEYDIDIEYEIDSLSDGEDDRDMLIFQSSGESDTEDVIFAAAVVGDSSIETFITDGEDSDNSRMGDSSSGLTDFWVCIQCKSQNDNPQFRFCDKCFQDRKAIFPPRPRRRKKQERTEDPSNLPVKLETLQTCLNRLTSSQDSGISSSQECDIVFPQINIELSEKKLSSDEKSRKRQLSESSLSDEYEDSPPRKKMTKQEDVKKQSTFVRKIEDNGKSENGVVSDQGELKTKNEQVSGPLPELKEDCIICNIKPKNSVFLHGRIAHMCCCYTCAMRTWKSLKRCPICKRKVSNVVRVFTT